MLLSRLKETILWIKWRKCMNTKDNRRTRQTRRLLKDAYIDLMQDRPVSKITVKALCDSADLNRSTFYLHYEEPNDVLKDIENETIENLRGYLLAIGTEKEHNISAVSLPFLNYVKENGKLFSVLLVNNENPYFLRKLTELTAENIRQQMGTHLQETYESMVFSFIISGSLSVLTEWIRSDFLLPAADLALLITMLCISAIERYEQI